MTDTMLQHRISISSFFLARVRAVLLDACRYDREYARLSWIRMVEKSGEVLSDLRDAMEVRHEQK